MHYEHKSVHSWLLPQALTFLANLLDAFMTDGWISTTWTVFWAVGMSCKDQDGALVQLLGSAGSCLTWAPLLSCCCIPQLEQDCGSVQEYPVPDQNKTSPWHCCGQMCLSMRISVIGSEPDFLVVLWGSLTQRCCVINYNFCHLTQHSVGKISCSEEHKMWNGNSKILVFLSSCSLDPERRPKPQMTMWFLTHHLCFQVPLGCVCLGVHRHWSSVWATVVEESACMHFFSLLAEIVKFWIDSYEGRIKIKWKRQWFHSAGYWFIVSLRSRKWLVTGQRSARRESKRIKKGLGRKKEKEGWKEQLQKRESHYRQWGLQEKGHLQESLGNCVGRVTKISKS